MEKDDAYRQCFYEAEPHSQDKLQLMSTERLITELDDIVNILANGEIDGTIGKAYRRIITELITRCEKE